jgi:PLD-like domain
VRLFFRLLVTLGLLLSAAAVAPFAAADPSGSALPSTGVVGDPSPSGTATDEPSGTGSSNPSGPSDPSDTASPSKSLAPSDTTSSSTPKALSRSLAAAADLHTTITRKPANPTTARNVTFSYSADKPLARFHCSIDGPGQAGTVVDCPVDTAPDAPGTTSGSKTFEGLDPSARAYTFKVTAYFPAVPTVTPEQDGTTASYDWRVYSVYAPGSFVPGTGASFNNPLGSSASRRTNLTRVIRTMNSMPGYKEPASNGAPCPSDPDLWPSKIRVSLYSMFDGSFASTAIRASRRCVSVQVLMNNHLSSSNDFAWRNLENALGRKVVVDGVARRSFAHRCNYGCRGSGVLHTKMYLFDSQLPAPSQDRNKINYTTMVGSSNMTSNAAKIQWNDLYGVKNYEPLYSQFLEMFNLMKKDNGFHRNRTYPTVGPYNVTFWPVASGRPDPELGALKSIACGGATGGTGTNGHTLVRINMHAWFGVRGLNFVKAVRSLYSRGCTVKILYSFMTPRVYHRLHDGTGSRMSLRRTVFSLNGDRYADVYSHFKNIMASGNVGGDSSARVVWTGSNNFTPDGTHFDEVMLRIKDAGAYNQYVGRFKYISNRKSSSRYASFLEPVGGGRAPKQTKEAQLGAAFAPSTPVIISPDIKIDEDGTPHALD